MTLLRLDNVGKSYRTLRQLLHLVGQILSVRRYSEHAALRRKGGCHENNRNSKSGDRCCHKCNAPRG